MSDSAKNVLTDVTATSVFNSVTLNAGLWGYGFAGSEHVLLEVLRGTTPMLHAMRHRLARDHSLSADAVGKAIDVVAPAGSAKEAGPVPLNADALQVFADAAGLALVYEETPHFTERHLLIALIERAIDVPDSGVGKIFHLLKLDAESIRDLVYTRSGIVRITKAESARRLMHRLGAIQSMLNLLSDRLAVSTGQLAGVTA